MKHPWPLFPAVHFIPVLMVLALAVLALYGIFLSSRYIAETYAQHSSLH